MRTLILTVLFCLAPVMAAAQTATPMHRLERYCIATGGDGLAAIKAARADGFVTPPMELLPDLPKNIEDLEMVWTVFDGGVAMLLTGQMNDRESGLKGEVCAVASMPQTSPSVKQFSEWVGSDLGGNRFVMFSDDGKGARKVIRQSDQRAVMQAVRDETLKMAAAMDQKQMTLLMLVALRL